MSNVAEVLLGASTLINDFSQKQWNKEHLQVFLKRAHRELQLELQLNGIPVIKKKAAIITIPQVDPLTYSGEVLLPNPPVDIIEPLECWERPSNSSEEFDLMIQKSWVPEVKPIQDLIYWNWLDEKVKFIGATRSIDVKLYYQAGLPIPVADEDLMGFINAELYIEPRLAALAARSLGAAKSYTDLTEMAKESLDKILQSNILNEQSLPVRRRPFRFRRRNQMIR